VHDDALEAEADGQVENHGGGTEAAMAMTLCHQGVVTQMRGHGGHPQQSGQPVAAGQAWPFWSQILTVAARSAPKAAAISRLPAMAA
jgi:hypothetical protein